MPDPGPAAEPHAGQLSETEVAIARFEQSWWKHAGAKECAVLEQFSMSLTRYYQVLNALIDRTEALAYDPVTVNRLRRLRDERRRGRTGGSSVRDTGA